MENKETFVMYKSYIDATDKIKNNDDKLEFLLGVCRYSLTGIEPTFESEIADIVFTAIKPSIDGASKRYTASVENGKKGGAPKGNANAKKKQPKNNPENNPEQPNETTKNNLYVYDDVYDDVYVDDNVYVDEDVNVDVYVYEDDNALINDVCNIIDVRAFRSDYDIIKNKVLFQNGTFDEKILSIIKFFEDTFGKTPMAVQDVKNKLNQLKLN